MPQAQAQAHALQDEACLRSMRDYLGRGVITGTVALRTLSLTSEVRIEVKDHHDLVVATGIVKNGLVCVTKMGPPNHTVPGVRSVGDMVRVIQLCSGETDGPVDWTTRIVLVDTCGTISIRTLCASLMCIQSRLCQLV